jgi:hypothetical protein
MVPQHDEIIKNGMFKLYNKKNNKKQLFLLFLEGNEQEQIQIKVEIETEDPADVLDKNKCLESLAALRHAKWFQVKKKKNFF